MAGYLTLHSPVLSSIPCTCICISQAAAAAAHRIGVGCNKLRALHRGLFLLTFGAMRCTYCTLHKLPRFVVFCSLSLVPVYVRINLHLHWLTDSD